MASVVQSRWRESNTADSTTSASPFTTLTTTLTSSPTAGNLLVFYAVGRNASAPPTISFAGSGSEPVTVVRHTTPMQFHAAAVGYRVVEAGDPTAWTATMSNTCHSGKIGVVEFDLTDAVLDASNSSGSNTSSVPDIPSGSTGTLSSSTGLWVSVGVSRTASASLSQDGGGAALFENTANSDGWHSEVQDHGQANSAAAWANLSSTDALNVKWTEASGSSPMGAIIVVFVAGGGPEPGRVGPQVVMFT